MPMRFAKRYDALFFTRPAYNAAARTQGNSNPGRWQRDKKGNWKAPIAPVGQEARAIGATGLEQRLLRAVLASLLRHPDQIARHRETLANLHVADRALGQLLAAMIAASFRKETVETDTLLTILGPSELYNMAKGMLRADTFTITPHRMTADADRVTRDLEEAIGVMAQGPELDAALAEATRRARENLNEESYAEQQRIHRMKLDHDSRLAELTQPADID